MNGIGRKPTPGTCDGINNYGNKTGKDITMQTDKESGTRQSDNTTL